MGRESGVPPSVAIVQDEHTEVHVQAVVQSGRRHVDIRTWRRGPSGFAPSRNALALEPDDLDALEVGIGELLEASNGGHQVARIVSDHAEGRRLRLEVEPFGTRFAARLGFWQRVRNTWRPADDGLVIPSDQLTTLREALQRFRPWLTSRAWAVARPSLAPRLDRWPPPGADWLTVEPDRVAFHPLGVHVTAVRTGDAADRVSVRQWQRHESIWLPQDLSCALTLADLETLLTCLSTLTDESVLTCEDGSRLRLRLEVNTLDVERAGAGDGIFAPVLTLPAGYLARFGRMVAEIWSLLASQMTDGDLARYVEHTVDTEEAPEAPDEAPIEEPAAEPILEEPVEEPAVPEPPRKEPEEDPVVSVGTVRLGQHTLELTRRGQHGTLLGVEWEGDLLVLPANPALLTSLRTLYYDALRGWRGHARTIGTPAVRASVHSRNLQTYLLLEQEADDGVITLSFPTREIPTFLDAVQTVLAVE